MASVVVILGSIAGFAAALTGWLAFDLSTLAALAIWIGSGPVSALVALAMASPAAPEQQPADRLVEA